MLARNAILASGSAVMFSLALAQSQPAAAAVTKYHSDGAGASAYWYDSCSFVAIDVSDGNGAGSQDFLYYWGYDCSENYFEGYGAIPDGAVKVTGNTASLSVDVSTLQGFYYYGTPLRAAVTWKADGTCSDKNVSNGKSTYSYDGQSNTYKYNSKYSSSCADASGNIGGSVFFSGTTPSASIYDHRSISREFVRP